MFEVNIAELEVKQSKLNDSVYYENVDQTFQGDFPTVLQFVDKLSFGACFCVSPQAGQTKMFEVVGKDPEV